MHRFDRNHKNLKALNSKGFSASTSDVLNVKTTLISTEITNDITIAALLNVDTETTADMKISQTFKQYIKPSSIDSSKRILFMTQILDNLWKILHSIPNEENHVFSAFVQTVHPILMNKKMFGYAENVLKRYVESKFYCLGLYQQFISSFLYLIQQMESVNAVSVTEYTHAMMSMKFIFMFIIKAYKFNKESDESFGSIHFCHLIQTLGDFLRKRNGNKMLRSQAFKALFDVDTLNIISEIVPGVILVDILKDILEENDTKSRDCNILNAVGEILISDIFFDDSSQETIFRFAVKLVSCQFPNSSEEYDASFEKGPLKERALGLIRTLYEVCTKIENGKIRANYLKTLTIEIVPHLIKVIAVNCSDLIHHNNIL